MEEKKTPPLDKEKIKRGLRLALIIFAVTTLVLLTFTVQKKTGEALRNLHIKFLAFSLILWAFFVLFDALRIVFLGKIIGYTLNLFKMIKLITIGIFLAAVTPFQVSGLPVQIYLLAKDGVSPGDATAILVTRGITTYFFILILLPPGAFYIGVSRGAIFKMLFIYIAVILIVIVTFYFLTILNPKRAASLIPQRFSHIREKFIMEVGKLRDGFLLFLTGRKPLPLALAFLTAFLSLLSLILMVYTLLLGLGVKPGLLKVGAIQLLLQGSLIYTPTPGATGVAESVGFALFSIVCPKYLLGIFVLMWRFFTFYLNAIVGGIFFLQESVKF